MRLLLWIKLVPRDEIDIHFFIFCCMLKNESCGQLGHIRCSHCSRVYLLHLHYYPYLVTACLLFIF